jgi:reductive dehalogenase
MLIAIGFAFERSYRAVFVSLLFSLIAPLPFFLSWYFNFLWFGILLNIITPSLFLLLLIPFRKIYRITDDTPAFGVDERDTLFSRNELVPGTPVYEEYYSHHPEKLEKDNKFRNQPGLLSKEAKYYHGDAFSKAQQLFKKVKNLHPRVSELPVTKPVSIESDKETLKLKEYCLELGASDAAITRTHAYHFYGYGGRAKRYGKKVINNHSFAIVFTVEMNNTMVKAAPKASIVLESARQYLNSAEIAIKVAEYIRGMGYEARAHIDGNYEVICPLVARDAGLGEIGRMGLLMTPTYGPRVRIAVVTTNMPLLADRRKPDTTMQHFCLHCKKCAHCCPGNSISLNPPDLIDRVKRWQIDSESCFKYWCIAGTDCGRCMSVCPYSHPNTLLHRLVCRGIRNNALFRRMAIYLDDLFYGRRPKPQALPEDMIRQKY